MLKINVLKYYKELEESIYRLLELINTIECYSPYDQTKDILKQILKSETKVTSTSHIYEVKNKKTNIKEAYLKAYKDFKKNFKFMEFHKEIIKENEYIKQIFKEYNQESLLITRLLESFFYVIEEYEELIQSDEDTDTMIRFFSSVENCIDKTYNTSSAIHSFLKTLEDEESNQLLETEEKIELKLLNVEYNLAEFSEILTSINNAYSSISILYKDVTINNLKIVSLESGSLHSILIGDKSLIDLLKKMLIKIADLIYKKITLEGKIKLNSEIMNTFLNDTEIIASIEKMGIDTEESKENIKAALNKATKELCSLVSKAPAIEVDDINLSVNLDNQKYLEFSNKLLDTKTEDKK